MEEEVGRSMVGGDIEEEEDEEEEGSLDWCSTAYRKAGMMGTEEHNKDD